MSDQKKRPANLCTSDDNLAPKGSRLKEYSGKMDKGEWQRNRDIHLVQIWNIYSWCVWIDHA